MKGAASKGWSSIQYGIDPVVLWNARECLIERKPPTLTMVREARASEIYWYSTILQEVHPLIYSIQYRIGIIKESKTISVWYSVMLREVQKKAPVPWYWCKQPETRLILNDYGSGARCSKRGSETQLVFWYLILLWAEALVRSTWKKKEFETIEIQDSIMLQAESLFGDSIDTKWFHERCKHLEI